MSQATKALDDFSRKERARNIRSALICLVLIVVILFAGFLFSVGDLEQVQGTTKGLYGHPGDQGESMFLLVRLDDGKDVKVALPDKVPFIKDSRIIATETTTRLLGIRRYSFLQYMATEKPSNSPLEPIR